MGVGVSVGRGHGRIGCVRVRVCVRACVPARVHCAHAGLHSTVSMRVCMCAHVHATKGSADA